ATSAAFAAGKTGRTADGLGCNISFPQNASSAARCAAIRHQCGGKVYANYCGDKMLSAVNLMAVKFLVGHRRACAVPSDGPEQQMVGTLRFAHPTYISHFFGGRTSQCSVRIGAIEPIRKNTNIIKIEYLRVRFARDV